MVLSLCSRNRWTRFARHPDGFSGRVLFPFKPGGAKSRVLDLSLLCFFIGYFSDDTRRLFHGRFRSG